MSRVGVEGGSGLGGSAEQLTQQAVPGRYYEGNTEPGRNDKHDGAARRPVGVIAGQEADDACHGTEQRAERHHNAQAICPETSGSGGGHEHGHHEDVAHGAQGDHDG